MGLKTAKNAVYGQILFGCCDVSLVILAHFPEFVVFVHSASKTLVVLGEFGGLIEKADVAPVLNVSFLLFRRSEPMSTNTSKVTASVSNTIAGSHIHEVIR